MARSALQQASILGSCICLYRPTYLSLSWLTFGTEPVKKMQRSLLTAIGQGRCPRCRKGYIFKYPLSQFRKFSVMNATCSSCEASFEPEPGFYFGALYVSYGFTVTLFFLVWAALHFLLSPPDWVYYVSFIGSAALFIPISFRYSRILFLYWFGGLGRKIDS
ncbi:MAG TPA: DUF983 domain-containing protein [Cyclobacteriaceae bacterium]|nr:DUF983 domain-containing protein [Cyclobacteriaceae bacterium]